MLVHMTPNEVQGLQALALAHGGSLSINPDTGLYEAGWLSKLLPTLIGAVLTPLTGGLINPMTAGLLVGGVETIRTGDIGKGLMAGLGAYGGAGLASSLAGAGAVAGNEALQTSLGAAKDVAATAAEKAAAEEAANKVIREQIAKEAANKSAMTFGNIGKGVGSLFSSTSPLGTSTMSGIGNVISGIGGPGLGGTVAKAGLANTALNVATPDYEQPDLSNVIDESYYQSYGYDPQQGRFLGGQWQKGYPGFPRRTYADGGVIPRPNPSYPQANITQSNYAAPFQYNRPQELIDGYEPKINPFTGEERFDGGGDVGDTMSRRPRDPGRADPTGTPPPSLKDYYQSLLAPPQAAPSNAAFMDYMAGLNKFVTSPVAPPKPAAPPATTPPVTPPTTNPPATGGTGTLPTFTYNPMTGEPMDLSSILGLNTGADGRMVYDRASGRFVTPKPPVAPTVPTTPTAPVGGDLGLGSLPMEDLSQFGLGVPMGTYGFAGGGSTEYAAAGKLLRGPGDGMSDDIKANIGGHQEARLADGEFVVPADVVSHLGNGSTEAGSRRLYKMMDDVRQARTGKKKQAPAVKAEKYMPK